MQIPLQNNNLDYSFSTGSEVGVSPDGQGYYGRFGGAYVPEMLFRNVEELRARYLDIINNPSFQDEYQALLVDYVGRPTPLYFASGLSKRYNARIFFKKGRSLSHRGPQDQ